MIKFLISYFYQIRFFKPYIVPFSTAAFPPKWFHQNKGRDYVFKDKNGVYNGIEATPLIPQIKTDGECHGPKECDLNPDNCGFLSNYYSQLKTLDFNEIYKSFERLTTKVKNLEKFEKDPVAALIVFETPSNPCSERVVLKKWFKENDIILEEFDKSLV